MAGERRPWTRKELLVALGLYLRTPFGQISQRNIEIIRHAALLNRTPAALSMKMGNLAGLDSSLERSGLRNASQADRELWAELQSDWSATADAIAEANQAVGAPFPTNDESQPKSEGQDVIAETKTRRGQALFRATVLSAYQGRCCITGLAEPRLLNASHIVPWRDDPRHRLNPRNGLCLSALHDRAFDRGLIALDTNYRLLLSSRLTERSDEFVDVSFFQYEGKQIELPEKLAPDRDFLTVHRQTIFIR
ncbi:MAG: HNH endonuclease [Chloroflexi bacterium]|nr:HNH endonuclease [Chloroflexota bacterium]MCY3695687.1 HNH endonuclease [Chloroflexota bacterium]